MLTVPVARVLCLLGALGPCIYTLGGLGRGVYKCEGYVLKICYHDIGVLQNKTSDVRITDEICKVTYLQVFLNQIKILSHWTVTYNCLLFSCIRCRCKITDTSIYVFESD
jgi:hypothetical protein